MPSTKSLTNLLNCNDNDFVDFIDVRKATVTLSFCLFRNVSSGNWIAD